jgi:hypothetical protein
MFIMYVVLNIILILFYFMFWKYYRVNYQPYFFSCWNYLGHFMQIEEVNFIMEVFFLSLSHFLKLSLDLRLNILEVGIVFKV